jgi:hypothetical protein
MDEPIPIDESLLPPEPHYQPAPRGLLNLNYRLLILFVLAWCVVGYFSSGPTMAAFSNWGLGGLVGVLVIYFFYRTRKVRRWTAAASDGARRLSSGDIDGAADVYEQLCVSSHNTPFRHLHAGFVYNRALAYMYSGHIDRALSLTMAVLKSRWFEEERYGMFYYLPDVLEHAARCYALQGHLEKAEALQALAHKIVIPERKGRLLLLDLIIAARRANYHIVLNEADERRASGESSLLPAEVKAANLVRAFALKMKTPDLSASDLETALATAKPFTSGQFNYLAGSWPEFREFLTEHNFIKS